MKKIVVLAIGMLFLLITCNVTFATPIGIGDFSGSETLVDFDLADITGGSYNSTSVTFGDVTITSDVAKLYRGPYSYMDNYFANYTNSGMDYMYDSGNGATFTDVTFTFDTVMDRAGLLLGLDSVADYTMIAYNNTGGVIESVSGSTNYMEAVFLGIQATGIASIRVIETSFPNNKISVFDDLRYESLGDPGPGPDPVPEPTTMLLLGVGLLGLFGVSRKKKNN